MLSLLKLLEDGHFHSGQALGSLLGVSRTAVWKRVQQVEEELGISLHKVKGKGYRLPSPLSLLSEALLSERLKPWPVTVLTEVDSTNAEVMRHLERSAQPPFLILAERQTAGRGRRGRKWISPFAENLYYSLAIPVVGGARQLEGLSLVVGLAVLRILHECGIRRAGLKWPNDILVADKKIAGILLELTGDPADVCNVIIGIGINVNMVASAEAIGQPWTSMREELGQLVSRDQLALKLSESLQGLLEQLRTQGFESLRPEWERHHLWQHKQVDLVAGENRINGVALGIDERGALRLETPQGIYHYSAGELSLRLRDDS
ncbi:bifunctional biotin--[acetyl-CoA-carboxylase] ligase/biotin operon repressor BirA [Pseudomonas sp. RIT-PI-AD]|uniref:bifunctional biotin--[acetyl-CoA-carboxylase] ligase/biotin operon repressor BirA n=1 Tax=Pseudomonas sp. RIT-PI-AD TaxID=3035294 RepID=UPI0021D9F075|nr:bifunctional biotin--[acetyl-CoA-carboxylase] ligase/biotin operon repressor BirA [Pseudomonas sp. RIT-PI-AD]